MRLASLLKTDTIIPDLKATDKRGIIREMVDMLALHKLIDNPDKLEKALLDRERLGSTGVGNHVAIPHAKSEDVGGLVAAFGKSKNGVDFDALDQKKVHYFFLLLASKGDPGSHLKVLARISRLFRQEGFCDKLKSLSASEDILKLIDVTEQAF